MAPLAHELKRHGWAVHTPDLRAAAVTPRRFASEAIMTAMRPHVVIGHSGAGVFLPRIAHSLNARAMVFIDAVVPDAASRFAPRSETIRFLDQVTDDDGVLLPWHQWWPPAVMDDLMPNARERSAFIEEIPRVPRSCYDEPVELPDAWWTWPGAYLQLGPAYVSDRERAEAWGWPTRTFDGGHLALATRPHDAAVAVIDLIGILFGRT